MMKPRRLKRLRTQITAQNERIRRDKQKYHNTSCIMHHASCIRRLSTRNLQDALAVEIGGLMHPAVTESPAKELRFL